MKNVIEPGCDPKTLRIELSQKELSAIQKALQEREAFLQPDLFVLSNTYYRNAPEPEQMAAEMDLLRNLRAKLSFFALYGGAA
jgi:predicted MPP superfamily phosphohydrolase